MFWRIINVRPMASMAKVILRSAKMREDDVPVQIIGACHTHPGWQSVMYGMGFAEGHAGRLLADLAQNAGLSHSWTWMNSETRTCTILVSQNGDATLINEPGTPVTKSAWKRLGQDVRKNISSAGLARMSGSSPPNSSSADLQGLRTCFQQAGDNLRFRSLRIFGSKHKFKLGKFPV